LQRRQGREIREIKYMQKNTGFTVFYNISITRCCVEYSVRDVTPRPRRPRLPVEMRRRPHDLSSDDDDDGDGFDDVSSDDDDVSSDVSGSSVRRRRNKDDDSDVPRFFYGRASDNVATATDRQLQTDDVSSSCVPRDAAVTQTDDVDTPRISRDTSIVGMSNFFTICRRILRVKNIFRFFSFFTNSCTT